MRKRVCMFLIVIALIPLAACTGKNGTTASNASKKVDVDLKRSTLPVLFPMRRLAAHKGWNSFWTEPTAIRTIIQRWIVKSRLWVLLTAMKKINAGIADC